jgi:SOS response regulatory protein OraA/RecX
MQTYFLRQSSFDPSFFEIQCEGVVVAEVKILFVLRSIPRSFSSQEEILQWLQETEAKLAKAYAYRLLGGRSYAKAALSQKMKGKGFSEEVCRKIIGEIEELGYLSDGDFAGRVIEQKMRQGYGPFYIERYLQQKGLDPTLVRLKIDEKTQKALLEKWMNKLRSKDRKQKISFLIRKGFDIELIQCM